MRVLSAFIFFCFLLINDIQGQDTITVFFDKDWKEVDNENLAVYFRKAYPDSNKMWTACDYYISKKIQMTGTYKSKRLNARQGHFIYFFENGQKSSEGDIVNDRREGLWNFWHENGRKESDGKFIKDKKEGIWVYYHDNGQKKAEGNFVADKHEGVWVYWFNSGEKKTEGKFLYGLKSGVWVYWYKNGQVSSEESFDLGIITAAMAYHDNGNILFKGVYVDNRKYGEWNYWNYDGALMFKGSYIYGLQHGEWIRYFRKGQPMKIYFERGVMVGRPLGGIVVNK
jgi:uncharacterized protein